MSDELLHILSDGSNDIDNQKLMDYINDTLSSEEKHEFEKSMADSAVLNDIVEGLEKFKSKKQMDALVAQLNNNLKHQLDKRKAIKNKRKIKDIPLLYLSIVIILILILVGFLVIKKHLENEHNSASPVKKEVIIKK